MSQQNDDFQLFNDDNNDLTNPADNTEMNIDSKSFGDNPTAKHEKKSESKWKNLSKPKKALTIVFSVVASILIICLISYFVLHSIGFNSLFGNTGKDISIPENEAVYAVSDGSTIFYNGQKYVFNNNVTTIACIGVGENRSGNAEGVIGSGGEADAVYLLTINIESKEYNVISISRDSMVDIDKYATDGSFVGVSREQLCLSFDYGDGKKTSSENTVSAISRMFYNIPIDTYFTLYLSGIPTLNDAVGGVTVPEFTNEGKETGNKISKSRDSIQNICCLLFFEHIRYSVLLHGDFFENNIIILRIKARQKDAFVFQKTTQV